MSGSKSSGRFDLLPLQEEDNAKANIHNGTGRDATSDTGINKVRTMVTVILVYPYLCPKLGNRVESCHGNETAKESREAL
jgi:hypothetical protein